VRPTGHQPSPYRMARRAGLREAAADQDRRIGLLHRLGPGHHFRKIDHVAVTLSLGLGPDLLHRLDPLAHKLNAGLEHGAVVLHFILVPAAANTDRKRPFDT